jgi:hypothetical protein
MARATANYIISAKDKTKAGVSSAKKNFKSVDGVFKNLQTTLAGVAGGFAVFSAALKGVEISRYAAQIQDVRTAFQNIASSQGMNAVKVLDDMKRATAGTLEELTLMQKFNEAAGLGVPMEEFAAALEIARVAAKTTGQSVEWMTSSIVTGLARQSTRIIDNVQITMSATEANEYWAESIGKTVDELTDQEKRVAFMKLAMKKGRDNVEAAGGAAAGAADTFTQLTASVKDLGGNLGAVLLPKVSSAANWLAKGAQAASDFLDKMRPLNREFREWLSTVRAESDPSESIRQLTIQAESYKKSIEDTDISIGNIIKESGYNAYTSVAIDALERSKSALLSKLSEVNGAIFAEGVEKGNKDREKREAAAQIELKARQEKAEEEFQLWRAGLVEIPMPTLYINPEVSAIPDPMGEDEMNGLTLAKQSWEEFNAVMQSGLELKQSLSTEGEIYTEQLNWFNELLAKGAIDAEAYDRALAQLNESTDGLSKGHEMFGQTFDAVWGSMLDGPEAMGRAMKRLGIQLAGAAIKKMILDKMAGAAGASTKAAEGAAGYHAAYSAIPFIGPMLAASNIAKMYADIAMAKGGGAALAAAAEGSAYAYGPTLVGERGPELVNFRTPGQVTPNHEIGGSGGGGGITINISGDLIADDTTKDNLARDMAARMGALGVA